MSGFRKLAVIRAVLAVTVLTPTVGAAPGRHAG